MNKSALPQAIDTNGIRIEFPLRSLRRPRFCATMGAERMYGAKRKQSVCKRIQGNAGVFKVREGGDGKRGDSGSG